MTVYDLAADVGLVKGSDEYDTFVSCVHNILELGCGYNQKATKDIIEKCKTSKLDIAKRVLAELRDDHKSDSHPRFRERKLKWWETYVPRRERISRDIHIDRVGSTEPRRRNKKRPMSPMFQSAKKRPMSPMFDPPALSSKPRKRPMSPMFKGRNKRHRSPSPVYERRSPSDVPSRYASVPQWGEERHHTHKRYRPESPQNYANSSYTNKRNRRHNNYRKRRRY